MVINAKDRDILRELASRQSEYAASNRMQGIVNDWKAHNNFRSSRPMVYLEINAYKDEVIEPRMRCEGEFARKIEEEILYNIVNFEYFYDDKIVPDYFGVEWNINFYLFGLKPKKVYTAKEGEKKLAYHIEPIIKDFPDVLPLLDKSSFNVNRDLTARKFEILSETFGDILPVRMHMNCLRANPTQRLIMLMGMENIFYAMCDYPDEFRYVMHNICNAFTVYFRWMETEKLLFPTVGSQRLGQGTYCFTDELPSEGDSLKTKDVWAHMDSQESAPISPEMFEKMIFPCYRDIASNFGLLSYGCCEPVHPIWESCLSKLDNLRKISISVWCDENYMGEQLRGKKIVYHRKPSPNFLSTTDTLDEDGVTEHIRATCIAASGCTLEIAQRDVCTINNDLRKARRYVELVRKAVDKYYKP